MKKIIGFLLVCLFAVSCSSLSGKKGILDKTLEGTYVKTTNTFTYKKNNLKRIFLLHILIVESYYN